ncbi:MAG TPA: hypothetical protein VEK86_05930, partial [Gemmatimonadales bacterium]|nr:hypothetical protein [Gemmatimonadales bacterium]
SDEYSLACVVYEMVVGEPPFTGPTAQAIIARHSLDMVSPPSIVRATIPDAVEDAILRALAKVPADRYPTTALFAEALNTPSRATGAARRATLARRAGAARGARWRIGLAGGALALAVVGWLAWRRSGSAARPAVSGGGLDPRHVAVLYFADLSAGGELGYLADGFTEALIDQLGQVRTLHVISPNGVAPYRRGDLPRDSIARALAVGSLVEGSVEPAGTRVRVTVRLVDGASGADVERTTLEQPAGAALVIRDSLTREVARFLRARLGEEVRLREERAGTGSVDAWVLVQRAERIRKEAEALVAGDAVDAGFSAFARADSVLAQAERLDPAWTDPIVRRGWIAYRRARLLQRQPAEATRWIETGGGHAERGLALAEGDPRALELRGTLRYYRWLLHREPDPARAAALLGGARADLEQAVARDPTLASAYSTLSHLYYQHGIDDPVAAVLAARRAYEEDAYLAVAHDVLWRLFTGSYDLDQQTQAQHWCAEGARRFPRSFRFVECQLWVMTGEGAPPEVARAWRLLARMDSLTPEPQRAYQHLRGQMVVGGVIARAGLKDSARRVLERSRGTPELDPDLELVSFEAFMRTLLGDQDQAIDLLKRYVAANPEVSYTARSWWWRDLSKNPRFREILAAGR